MPKKKPTYRIVFHNQGKIYELYSHTVRQGELFGFIEVGDIIFGERSAVLIDPSEERLKTEFGGVNRTYVPMHAVIRIDQVDKQGVNKIVSGEEGKGQGQRDSLPGPDVHPGAGTRAPREADRPDHRAHSRNAVAVITPAATRIIARARRRRAAPSRLERAGAVALFVVHHAAADRPASVVPPGAGAGDDGQGARRPGARSPRRSRGSAHRRPPPAATPIANEPAHQNGSSRLGPAPSSVSRRRHQSRCARSSPAAASRAARTPVSRANTLWPRYNACAATSPA